MATYSIRDLEKLSGIKAHTIRIWEKRYNLVSPMRTNTNIRYYCDNDLKKLLNISILNRSGYKISKIADLGSDEIKEKVVFLINDTGDRYSQIESLVLSMIELDEKKFEKVLNTNILKLGFEKTILDIIHPFLERIGILWQTGKINPAQEHFISNLVRQKIIVSIENILPEENSNPKKFLLFLPEGELHELGLLFYNYLLKKKGHRAIYLGQSVPFDDLVEVDEIKSCDYLLTAFITAYTDYDINDYINKLSKTFKDKNIYVLGRRLNGLKKFPKNIILVFSPNDFLEKI